MTVKAVALVEVIAPNGSNVDLYVRVAGLVGGENYQLPILGMDPTITNLTWEAAIKQAVRNDLIGTYSYSFGLFDTVRLVGNTLI